jgi:hypothetical protein
LRQNPLDENISDLICPGLFAFRLGAAARGQAAAATNVSRHVYQSLGESILCRKRDQQADKKDLSWPNPVHCRPGLTVYAPYAEDNLPELLFLFVQQGNNPLTEMTMDYLGDLMQGNAKAWGLLRKGKVRKAIEKYNE